MSVILQGSMVFLAVAVIGSLIFGVMARLKTLDATAKNSNFCIAIFSVFLSCICMWVMWVCAYMHQMNPIIYPQIKSE